MIFSLMSWTGVTGTKDTGPEAALVPSACLPGNESKPPLCRLTAKPLSSGFTVCLLVFCCSLSFWLLFCLAPSTCLALFGFLFFHSSERGVGILLGSGFDHVISLVFSFFFKLTSFSVNLTSCLLFSIVVLLL